jgi:hypothetical protein
MANINQRIAGRVKYLRTIAGMSVEQLADKAGIPHSTLYSCGWAEVLLFHGFWCRRATAGRRP